MVKADAIDFNVTLKGPQYRACWIKYYFILNKEAKYERTG